MLFPPVSFFCVAKYQHPHFSAIQVLKLQSYGFRVAFLFPWSLIFALTLLFPYLPFRELFYFFQLLEIVIGESCILYFYFLFWLHMGHAVP